MVKIIFVAFLCLTIFCLAVSNPPEFNYDFTGFQQLTKLLPTNCDNITGQVMSHLGGIQKPTHDFEHIECEADEIMGTRIKLTIHRDLDDDAITEDTTKQRLEIYTGKRKDLHAANGTTFVFAWWFFVSSSVVADTNFWHIFQIKPSGASVDTNPTLTFTLKTNYGLHYEFFEDHHGSTQYIPMLSLNEAKGKWIQAYVKAHFSENGYAEIYLKDLSGVQLFHAEISGNFWWDGAEYYYPKWGLYRRKSDIFNDSDFAFFQNVQMWRN